MYRSIFFLSLCLSIIQACVPSDSEQSQDLNESKHALSVKTYAKTPVARPVIRIKFTGVNSTCSATVIADNWILTAAHCLPQCKGSNKDCKNKVEQRIRMSRGEASLSNDGTIGNSFTSLIDFAEVETFPHHRYQPSADTVTYDIALIRTNKELPSPYNDNSHQMRLMANNTWANGQGGATLEALGFGTRSSDIFLGHSLLEVTSTHEHWFSTDVKTGYVCLGDSGGPAIRNYFTAPPVQIGIISQISVLAGGAVRCSSKPYFANVARYISWIMVTMREREGSTTDVCHRKTYHHESNAKIHYIQCFDDYTDGSHQYPYLKPLTSADMGKCTETHPCWGFEKHHCTRTTQCVEPNKCQPNYGLQYTLPGYSASYYNLPADAGLCVPPQYVFNNP